jgi:hypothetical protein
MARRVVAEIGAGIGDEEAGAQAKPRKAALTARAKCLCGAVEIEMTLDPVWAWHDHSPASRMAHGAAYATYVGSWRSKLKIVKGEEKIAAYENAGGDVRSFCATCGTPVMYVRKRSSKMVNVPRSLFTGRVGREPRYHVGIDEMRDWAYTGAKLGPLKGYPGVVVERPKRKTGQ